MNIINKNFIHISKLDIFDNMNKSFDKKDIESYYYFQNLSDNLFKFEKNNHCFIDDLYVPINDLSNIDVTISRQTLLNAYTYSNINKDFLISSDLEKFLSKKVVTCDELGGICDYVLLHGMDINELYDGEKKRLIYKDNLLKYDYVYNNMEKTLKKTNH